MIKTSRRRDFISQCGIIGAGLLTGNKRLLTKSTRKINQVIAAWPFMNTGPKWAPEHFIMQVKSLGVSGVELFPVEHWDLLKENNLICAATKSHTFVRGMNNKGHHAECISALEKAIDNTSKAGFPNVMTFTGLTDTSNETNGSHISLEEGRKNCIEGYKKVVALAERKNVTLLLEPLNSKVDKPMKGHPGYQGDHIDYCLDIIKEVSSPSLRLLFDVYHIQIMDGDIINHINKNIEYIAHVQIAGVPGRGEIGYDQEVNYKAIMIALLNAGYTGYVGHEWIPTSDPMTGLKQAINICDVSL